MVPSEVWKIDPSDYTWHRLLTNFLLVIAPLVIVSVADYYGWIAVGVGRLQGVLTLVGVVLMLGVGAFRRRSRWTSTYFFIAMWVGFGAVFSDGSDTRRLAQQRIALMNACEEPNLSEDTLEQCRETRARSSDLMCEWGRNPVQCRRDLYREAAWPLVESPLNHETAIQRTAAEDIAQ